MQKKISVLMIGSHTSVKGGMTTVVEAFLNNQFSENMNLQYIPTHIEGNKGKKMILFLVNYARIFFCLLLKDIDLVHMHMSERGSFKRKYLIFQLVKICKRKAIVHMHGAEFKEYYEESDSRTQEKIKKLLAEVHCVIVLGDKWNSIVKDICPDSKTLILRNAVDIPESINVINHQEITVLFLAVLIKRKGILDLIQAAPAIIKEVEKNGKKLNFIIAGDGEEEANAKNLVKELNISKYFQFMGWVDIRTKHQLLKKADLFVLPSYNEGLPVAILEAISYGIPIIATNVGSIDEAVKQDINGYLIPPGSEEELSQSMINSIKNNELKEMGKRSRELAVVHFNSTKYFEEIERIYLKL